ncbi:YceD family protein [Ferrovibrio xuzhouensis]|uniref:YceD family protein n=1 Tax=Ferrovibrio xuzhouensis TaxID=1576914 RepID=A0ABV7VKQ7_9PROT
MSKESLSGEFSHVVETGQISPEGLQLHLTASADECRALAERFGILAVLRLEARLQIRPDPVLAGCYVMSGQVDAEVEQACVVSLEPVRQRIAETFVRSFAPAVAGTRNEGAGEDEADWLDPDAADPPDLLEDDRIDAGEVVAEELALALDPYPRKAGADLPPEYHPEPEQAAKVSPFAVLAGLKAAKKD